MFLVTEKTVLIDLRIQKKNYSRVTSSLVTEGQTILVMLVHCSSIAEVLSGIHLQSQVKISY